jgi:hypothetical protein
MNRIGRLPTQLAITAVLATALSFVTPVSFTAMHSLRRSRTTPRIQIPKMTALKVERAKNHQIVFAAHLQAAGVLFVFDKCVLVRGLAKARVIPPGLNESMRAARQMVSTHSG